MFEEQICNAEYSSKRMIPFENGHDHAPRNLEVQQKLRSPVLGLRFEKPHVVGVVHPFKKWRNERNRNAMKDVCNQALKEKQIKDFVVGCFDQYISRYTFTC